MAVLLYSTSGNHMGNLIPRDSMQNENISAKLI